MSAAMLGVKIIEFFSKNFHENRVKKCFCSWPPTWPPWRHVQTSNGVTQTSLSLFPHRKQERSARRLLHVNEAIFPVVASLHPSLGVWNKSEKKRRLFTQARLSGYAHTILSCFSCRHENLSSLCTDPPPLRFFFFEGMGEGVCTLAKIYSV